MLEIALEHADENSDSVVNVTEVFLLFGKLALPFQPLNLSYIIMTSFFWFSLANATSFGITILLFLNKGFCSNFLNNRDTLIFK